VNCGPTHPETVLTVSLSGAFTDHRAKATVEKTVKFNCAITPRKAAVFAVVPFSDTVI
jgi:hypothetical protein